MKTQMTMKKMKKMRKSLMIRNKKKIVVSNKKLKTLKPQIR